MTGSCFGDLCLPTDPDGPAGAHRRVVIAFVLVCADADGAAPAWACRDPFTHEDSEIVEPTEDLGQDA